MSSIDFTFKPEDGTNDITAARVTRNALAGGSGGRWLLILDLWIGADGWDAETPVHIGFNTFRSAVESLNDISIYGITLRWEDEGNLATLEDGNSYFGRPVVQA